MRLRYFEPAKPEASAKPEGRAPSVDWRDQDGRSHTIDWWKDAAQRAEDAFKACPPHGPKGAPVAAGPAAPQPRGGSRVQLTTISFPHWLRQRPPSPARTYTAKH